MDYMDEYFRDETDEQRQTRHRRWDENEKYSRARDAGMAAACGIGLLAFVVVGAICGLAMLLSWYTYGRVHSGDVRSPWDVYATVCEMAWTVQCVALLCIWSGRGKGHRWGWSYSGEELMKHRQEVECLKALHAAGEQANATDADREQ